MIRDFFSDLIRMKKSLFVLRRLRRPRGSAFSLSGIAGTAKSSHTVCSGSRTERFRSASPPRNPATAGRNAPDRRTVLFRFPARRANGHADVFAAPAPKQARLFSFPKTTSFSSSLDPIPGSVTNDKKRYFRAYETFSTFIRFVVPDTPSGMPAVMTTVSPAAIRPACFAASTAAANSASV